MRSFILLLHILILPQFIAGQQNSTLFFMESAPQANFVNPAVRNNCKWMLGLPVISSIHLQIGNSLASFHQLFTLQADNNYHFNGNSVINNAGSTNFISTELHANLLFISFWHKKDFITISINEKADIFATYPHDLLALAWNGNTQFEGKNADLGRISAALNYRREYAVGLARQSSEDLVWGIRGKLLFGKLNTSTSRSDIQLYTEPVTYSINAISNWNVNTSLPIIVTAETDKTVRSVQYNGDIPSILLNRRNVGLAFDLGFIKYRDEKVTIAGSILDLGVIRWTSNAASFYQKGRFNYQGPLTNTFNGNDYLDSLRRIVTNEFKIRTTSGSYITFLAPSIYLGATYKLKDDLNIGILSTSHINRYRPSTGVTLSLNKHFAEKLSVSISYSYLYKSFKNLGFGLKLGKSPLQFYAVTDNILGLIQPLDTKNINIRFGLQFNFGCSKKESSSGCGCAWLKKEDDRRARNKRLLKDK